MRESDALPAGMLRLLSLQFINIWRPLILRSHACSCGLRDEEKSLAACANMPTRFFPIRFFLTGFRHLVSDRSERVMLNPYTPTNCKN